MIVGEYSLPYFDQVFFSLWNLYKSGLLVAIEMGGWRHETLMCVGISPVVSKPVVVHIKIILLINLVSTKRLIFWTSSPKSLAKSAWLPLYELAEEND